MARQSLCKSALSFSSTAQQNPSLTTLSMEVSYPFHSHLIGISGKNVNALMRESGTQIHFPDGNRLFGQRKSNSVAVRGKIANVEDAWQRIRANIPIEFIIDCFRIERINLIGQSSLADYFSMTFGVLLRFYPKIDGVNCQINIRGQQDRIEILKQAVGYLGHVTQSSVESVGMKMETSLFHVWLVREQVQKIVSATGAGIRCPDVSSWKELPSKYSVWIHGSMDSVLLAREMFIGLSPMQLMVQIPSDRLNSSVFTAAQDLDILFSVERSSFDIVTIRLTSYEWNACNLFDVLRCCLHLPRKEAVSSCLLPSWLELGNMTRNSFLLVMKKLLREMPSNLNTLPSKLSDLEVGIPKSSSPESCSPTFSSSFLPTKASIPDSLTTSRFNKNSFRQLRKLLDTVGLSRYTDLFFKNEVDIAMFTSLNGQDLISIGVSSFRDRKLMLNTIEELCR